MSISKELRFKILFHLKFIVSLVVAIEIYRIGEPNLVSIGLYLILGIIALYIWRDIKELSI